MREWDDADAPVMVELFDEPQVDQWMPLHHPFDLAAARAYLDRTRRAEGRSIQLAITSDGHTALGEILLLFAGPDGRRPGGPYAELAYAVGVRHRPYVQPVTELMRAEPVAQQWREDLAWLATHCPSW
ncbi:GNAT family N-acetyltransferase [Streptomyces sp. 3N207]|uniref:GNAT family N-acetyltransferase n=1 Tax=Streptomyces sp. 3N207 TaxID=3457417 RepID=UPI003FD4E447